MITEITAHHRIAMGHEVVILDPYNVARIDWPKASFNPLSMIPRQSPTAVDDARTLANALVIRTGEEKDPHFNDSAEKFIAMIIAATIEFSRGDHKSFHTVRNMMSKKEDLQAVMEDIKASPAWGGALSKMAYEVEQFQGDEGASVRTTMNRHMGFMDTPAMLSVLKSSSFDALDLRRKPMTIYLIPSLEHAQTLIPWIRLTSFMKACVKGGLE